MSRFKDLSTQIFGKLTVLETVGKNKKGNYIWKCRCKCGNITEVSSSDLVQSNTKSCGCLLGKTSIHGFTKRGAFHPFYGVWNQMIQRCTNPNQRSYSRYGGRGIKVCKKWLKFENFRDDLFEQWNPGLQIDRVNSDGNYELSNIRFVDRYQQARNKKGVLSIKIVKQIKKRLENKERQVNISRDMNISTTRINRIATGKTFANI